jgi:Ca2+-binding EF-hand superfamily protein/Leucine-rich repeat (LRR) protein
MWGKLKTKTETVVPSNPASLATAALASTHKENKKRKIKKGKVSRQELEGLRQVREELKPSLFTESPGWRKLEKNPNNCEGVVYHEDERGGLHTRRIILQDKKVRGPVPASLGYLADLIEINLSINRIYGSIPSALAAITTLQELNLSCNKLKESIPDALGKLFNLEILDLHSNLLTGSIPPKLSGCVKLTELYLHANRLTGTIPDSLGDIEELTTLQVHDNFLTGEIPRSLGLLTKLKSLYLHNNDLEGQLPSTFCQCEALQAITIQDTTITIQDDPTFQTGDVRMGRTLAQGVWGGPPPFLSAAAKVRQARLKQEKDDAARERALDEKYAAQIMKNVVLLEEFRTNFGKFDQDDDGTINTRELGTVMRSLGLYMEDEELQDIIDFADQDGDGNLGFDEFVLIMAHQMRGAGGTVKGEDNREPDPWETMRGTAARVEEWREHFFHGERKNIAEERAKPTDWAGVEIPQAGVIYPASFITMYQTNGARGHDERMERWYTQHGMQPVEIPKKNHTPGPIGVAAILEAKEREEAMSAAAKEVECLVCFDTVKVSAIRRCPIGHMICIECLKHLAKKECTECGADIRQQAVTVEELRAYGHDADVHYASIIASFKAADTYMIQEISREQAVEGLLKANKPVGTDVDPKIEKEEIEKKLKSMCAKRPEVTMEEFMSCAGFGDRYLEELQERLMRRVKKIFALMDLDGDGTIDKEEQQEFYRKSGVDPDDEAVKKRVEKQFARADRDGDGGISLEEFAELQLPLMKKELKKRKEKRKTAREEDMKLQGEQLEERLMLRVHTLFQEMDLDANGTISKHEQQEYYHRSAVDMHDERVKAYMDKQFANIDFNGDGSISLDEFAKVQLKVLKEELAKRKGAAGQQEVAVSAKTKGKGFSMLKAAANKDKIRMSDLISTKGKVGLSKGKESKLKSRLRKLSTGGGRGNVTKSFLRRYKRGGSPKSKKEKKKKEVIDPLTISGSLFVRLVGATGLKAMDSGGTSDPFVIACIGKQKEQTRAIQKTLTPMWNEEFEFKLANRKHNLLIVVKDQDLMTSEFMGQFKIDLAEIVVKLGDVHGEFSQWYPLELRYTKKRQQAKAKEKAAKEAKEIVEGYTEGKPKKKKKKAEKKSGGEEDLGAVEVLLRWEGDDNKTPEERAVDAAAEKERQLLENDEDEEGGYDDLLKSVYGKELRGRALPGEKSAYEPRPEISYFERDQRQLTAYVAVDSMRKAWMQAEAEADARAKVLEGLQEEMEKEALAAEKRRHELDVLRHHDPGSTTYVPSRLRTWPAGTGMGINFPEMHYGTLERQMEKARGVLHDQQAEKLASLRQMELQKPHE